MEKILIDAGPSEVGWSKSESAFRCERLFYLGHVVNHPRVDKVPLIRGSIGHTGLAHHFARLKAQQDGTDPEVYYTPLEAMQRCEAAKSPVAGVAAWKDGPPIFEIAVRAVNDHIAAWVGDSRLKIISVENEVGAIISTPSIAPYWTEKLTAMLRDMKLRKTQRLDLVVFDPARGVYLIIDHKFTGTSASPHAIRARYTLSGQFLLMRSFGSALYGAQFGGVLVNMVQVPSKYDNKTKFCRDAPDVAPHAMQLFPIQMHRRHERLEVLKSLHSPEEEYLGAWNEQVCNGPYGQCEAFEACQWGDL